MCDHPRPSAGSGQSTAGASGQVKATPVPFLVLSSHSPGSDKHALSLRVIGSEIIVPPALQMIPARQGLESGCLSSSLHSTCVYIPTRMYTYTQTPSSLADFCSLCALKKMAQGSRPRFKIKHSQNLDVFYIGNRNK